MPPPNPPTAKPRKGESLFMTPAQWISQVSAFIHHYRVWQYRLLPLLLSTTSTFNCKFMGINRPVQLNSAIFIWRVPSRETTLPLVSVGLLAFSPPSMQTCSFLLIFFFSILIHLIYLIRAKLHLLKDVGALKFFHLSQKILCSSFSTSISFEGKILDQSKIK